MEQDIHASAVATLLALGNPVPEAVRQAKTFISMAIQAGLSLGKGAGSTNPFAFVLREMERYPVMEKLKEAMERLRAGATGAIIPEVCSRLWVTLFPMLRAYGISRLFPEESFALAMVWPLWLIRSLGSRNTLPVSFLR